MWCGHQSASKTISQPEQLARCMAYIAHSIRDLTVATLGRGTATRALQELYEAFQKALLPDLTVAQFADLFAQTLAYGLFAARYIHSDDVPFNRQNAFCRIP